VFVDAMPREARRPWCGLSLPAGPHVIEVRNGRLRPLHMQVLLQPGEEMQLKHVFTAPAQPARRARPKEQPGVLDRFKFW
jgi:hypothetical protein